jgi:hypothetical protein
MGNIQKGLKTSGAKQEKKKKVKRTSSGDAGFDNAINKFFPRKSNKSNDIQKFEMTPEMKEMGKNIPRIRLKRVFTAISSFPYPPIIQLSQ